MNEPQTDEFPTLLRLGAKFAELEQKTRLTRAHRPGPGRRAKLALAGLATAAVAISPPGRAVAEWMGDLVGVGEVGGPPSSEERRPGPPASEVIVFANGETPAGERFEIVAYRSDDIANGLAPEGLLPGICVRAEFPDRAGGGSPGGLQIGLPGNFCYAGTPTEEGIRLGSTSSSADGGATITATGVASSETERVVLNYVDESGERQSIGAAVAHLSGELGRRIGVPSVTEPTTYFIAFLPGAGSEKIEAVAYDLGGNEIASDSISASPPADRIPSAGTHKRFEDMCEAPSSRMESFCNAQERVLKRFGGE